MFRSGLSEWQRTNACGISSQESAAAVVVAAAAAANFLVTPSARWSKCTLNFVDQSNSNHLCSNWKKTWKCRGVRTILTLCVAGWRPRSSHGMQGVKINKDHHWEYMRTQYSWPSILMNLASTDERYLFYADNAPEPRVGLHSRKHSVEQADRAWISTCVTVICGRPCKTSSTLAIV